MRDVVPDAGRSNGVVVDSPRADADDQQQRWREVGRLAIQEFPRTAGGCSDGCSRDEAEGPQRVGMGGARRRSSTSKRESDDLLLRRAKGEHRSRRQVE